MILLVGCGLAACSLAKIMLERNIPFMMYGDMKDSASHISSGIVNMISGRKLTLAWRASELLNSALEFYNIGNDKYIEPTKYRKVIYDPTTQNELTHLSPQYDKWIKVIDHQNIEIQNTYKVDINSFIIAIIDQIKKHSQFKLETLDYNTIEIDKNRIHYRGATYTKVIFADGEKIRFNRMFDFVPYLPNRGEALLIKDKIGINPAEIMHDNKVLCAYRGMLWLGSSFDRVPFTDPALSQIVYQELEKQAFKLISGYEPTQLIAHLGAYRCASHDRRPYVDNHPEFKNVFIFNGFGTKGTSLIPFFAKQLIDYIELGIDTSPEVKLNRIKKEKIYRTI